MERGICLLIGYLCGSFLTAELVARYRTGRSARELGSGNPGMANLAGQLGPAWGAAVLLGDVGKTALACLLGWRLCPALGDLAPLYAGMGAVLGHDFPLWTGFRGGKGVAVTCTWMILAQPLWGTACCLAGLGLVLWTGYLPLGAAAIPVLFLLPAGLGLGPEAGALALANALLMILRNRAGLGRVLRGAEPRHLRRKA